MKASKTSETDNSTGGVLLHAAADGSLFIDSCELHQFMVRTRGSAARASFLNRLEEYRKWLEAAFEFKFTVFELRKNLSGRTWFRLDSLVKQRVDDFDQEAADPCFDSMERVAILYWLKRKGVIAAADVNFFMLDLPVSIERLAKREWKAQLVRQVKAGVLTKVRGRYELAG